LPTDDRTVKAVTIYYHGQPRGEHAPWDGGYVWAQDSPDRPWVVTANRGWAPVSVA
jgi:hypothetical protein